MRAGLDRRAEFWARLAGISGQRLEGLELITERAVAALRNGGRLLFAGNGGSAADAQHLAAEYIGVGLPAIALTTDSSVLTALGNDFGFDEVFARQLYALGRPGDLLIVHSTSGNSENVIVASRIAAGLGIHTVALLAKGGGRMGEQVAGVLGRSAQTAFLIPTDDTALAQEAHLAIGHMVFEAVVAELKPPMRA